MQRGLQDLSETSFLLICMHYIRLHSVNQEWALCSDLEIEQFCASCICFTYFLRSANTNVHIMKKRNHLTQKNEIMVLMA